MASEVGVATARDYYDSAEADAFYHGIWGGEDIHIGLYDTTRDIREASRLTVEHMASKLGDLSEKHVLDIGSGYGGAARVLAGKGARRVTCLNISKVENDRNRKLNEAAALADRISVVDGSFDDLPFDDASFDVVWSQDAILHAPDRRAVLRELARVLRTGGEVIFTDPMQADGLADRAALQPIYDRIHLDDLASFGFYRAQLATLGFEEIEVEQMTAQLRTHYARVGEELLARRHEFGANGDFVERMLAGLRHWVDGADAGRLAWGVIHFRKTM